VELRCPPAVRGRYRLFILYDSCLPGLAVSRVGRVLPFATCRFGGLLGASIMLLFNCSIYQANSLMIAITPTTTSCHYHHHAPQHLQPSIQHKVQARSTKCKATCCTAVHAPKAPHHDPRQRSLVPRARPCESQHSRAAIKLPLTSCLSFIADAIFMEKAELHV
jgi:hypothetical protein